MEYMLRFLAGDCLLCSRVLGDGLRDLLVSAASDSMSASARILLSENLAAERRRSVGEKCMNILDGKTSPPPSPPPSPRPPPPPSPPHSEYSDLPRSMDFEGSECFQPSPEAFRRLGRDISIRRVEDFDQDEKAPCYRCIGRLAEARRIHARAPAVVAPPKTAEKSPMIESCPNARSMYREEAWGMERWLHVQRWAAMATKAQRNVFELSSLLGDALEAMDMFVEKGARADERYQRQRCRYYAT